MPRARSQRASQKPSRPASKATAMRVIVRPAFAASSRQRLQQLQQALLVGRELLQRLALDARHDPGDQPARLAHLDRRRSACYPARGRVRDRLRSFSCGMGHSIGSLQRRWCHRPRRRPIASSCGISSEDVLIPTERHPACRRREARPGSCKERENLAGDAQGKRRKRLQTARPKVPMRRRGADCSVVCAGQRMSQEGSSPSGARMRSAVSKGGGNASPASGESRWKTGCPERSGIRRV